MLIAGTAVRKASWFVAAILVLVVSVGLSLRHYARQPVRPVRDSTKVLAMLKRETRLAAGRVRSGKGKLSIHVFHDVPKGPDIEIRSTCQVDFSGDRFLIVEDSYSSCPPGTESLMKRVSRKIGSIFRPVSSRIPGIRRIYTSDGATAVAYVPSLRSAVVGKRGSLLWFSVQGEFLGCGLSPHKLSSLLSAHTVTNTFLKQRITQIFGRPKLLGRQRITGVDCFVVESVCTYDIDGEKTDYLTRSWICPSQNYLTLRTERYGPRDGRGDSARSRMLLSVSTLQAVRHKGGIWWPRRTETIGYTYRDGRRQAGMRRILDYDTQFRINPPAKSLKLAMKLPTGTKIQRQEGFAPAAVPAKASHAMP